MSRPVISVENLCKAYRIGLKEEIPDTLMSAVTSVARAPWKNLQRLRRLNTFSDDVAGPENEDTLWALKDVSFQVKEGEVLGIIGRNGAGKSTLLKILSRITEPTSGRIRIKGRVSSLLEVGTGFHPELSGRENIYMNGTILGMTKSEIDRKFDEIVDFSGVEKFLDTPVKRYSSGMKVRLAFAVAAHLEPEILIIDEVLAVGDAEFQRKCLGKMQDVATGGRTVLFVSHNMAAVEALCESGIWLKSGVVEYAGPVKRALALYHQTTNRGAGGASYTFRDSDLVQSIDLLGPDGFPTLMLEMGRALHFRIALTCGVPIKSPRVGIGIDNSMGARVLTVHTPAKQNCIGELSGDCEVNCRINPNPLAPGEYQLKLAVSDLGRSLESHDSAFTFTIVECDAFDDGRGFHKGYCIAHSEWSQTRELTSSAC